MIKLFVFTGNKNIAGKKNNYKLAIFFLISLFCFTNLFASETEKNVEIPFVVTGKVFSFSESSPENPFLFNFLGNCQFVQRGVSYSNYDGYFLAWDQSAQNLLLINNEKIYDSVKVSGANVYLNKNFILTQTSFFTQNKGFEYTLYRIKYSEKQKKIELKKEWNGFIDCFVSDCFFTDEGICICGGNKADSENNAFYITKKGEKKCFSTDKNSNFLRMVSTENEVYAFLSGRDKTNASPFIFKFDIDGNEKKLINIEEFNNYPKYFNCFFGYGFTFNDEIYLPSSVDKKMVFLKINMKTNNIQIINDITGCVYPITTKKNSFYFIAKDALTKNSFYGLSVLKDDKVIEKLRFN